MKNCKVIAFDIDGTLYPSWIFYICVLPYFFAHFFFFLNYGKVRRILHRTAPLPDLFEYQARLLAERTGRTVAATKEKIRKIVYVGLKPYFRLVRPFPYVKEAFKRLYKAGYTLAILSDFPPEQKGDLWGLLSYCKVVLGSERLGALKPSVYPFGILAATLGVAPSEILYVGNSLHYDIEGAYNAGMKTAYLKSWWYGLFHRRSLVRPDISFRTYRQLLNIVLQ